MKKIKITLSILLSVITFLCSHGQTGGGIFEGDVTLTSQAEVDAFPYTEVTGILTISGNSIGNLDGLSELTLVGGLTISGNANLTNVDGLSALSQAGSFIKISDNPNLENLDGFNNLTTVGPIEISNNTNLVRISGFHSLVSIQPSLSYPTSILIHQNDALTNLECFSALAIVGGIRISMNNQLTALDGFLSVAKLYGTLEISSNELLKSVNGFQGLTRIFSITREITDVGIVITNNPSLESFTGLSSLKEIYSQYFNRVDISNNPALKNIDGLSSLASIVADYSLSFQIKNNATLENIDGLSALIVVGAILPNLNFTITENPLLTQCCVLRPLLAWMDELYHLDTLIANGNLLIAENGGCTVEDIMSCGPQICQGDVVLSSQAEVDAFFCAKVIGNVTISGSDITDLTNLSLLTKVTGDLNIVDNPNLESLDGLIGLDTVGGILRIGSDQMLSNIDALNDILSVGSLYIQNNPSLLDIGLTSFSSLTNAGEFYFDNNSNLTTINGFNNLPSSRSITISNNPKLVRINAFNSLVMTRSGSLDGPGTISIYQNDALTDLDCFSSLTSVGGIRISMNNSLPSVDGFSSVSKLYGLLEIHDNASLKSINGFQGLTLIRSVQREVSIVGIIISNNPSLESLMGLSALETIDSQYSNRVDISNNPSLRNISGLSSLAYIAGEGFLSFQIKNNATLDNIEGLSALTDVGAILGYFNITISQNPSLTQCCPLRLLLEHLDQRFNLDTLIAKGALVISENGGCSVEDIISCGSQIISYSEVIDLRTGQKVETFYNDSVTLDLAFTDPQYLGIQAHTLPSIAGSVEFILGEIRHTENNYPYLFDPPRLDPGIYTVQVDVYSKPNKQGIKGVGKTFTIIVKNSAAIESYELVNAMGRPIRPLHEGDKINIKDVLFSKSVHIRAHVSSHQVTSVRFFLNGVFVRREMSAPFAFNGNNDEAYYPWKPAPGNYTILAIPYVIRNNKEYEGKSLEIHFTVEAQESPIAVESFDVVDTFGNILKQLKEGDQINIQDPMFKAINIIANTSGQVGSVNFWLNNKSYRTENGVPYTLAGDQNGKFNAWSVGVGDYKLSAIPHSESNAKGTVGKSLTVHFKVVNENVGAATRLVTSTGLNEELLFQEGLVGVSLYPVPVGHELNVKIDDVAAGKDAMLTIVNFQGLTLYKNSYAASQTINTLELKPGVYMLQIVSNSGFRRVLKFIKK